MDNSNKWSNWDAEKHYGELFYKRATGQLDEMESSKSVSRLIAGFHQPNETLLDVGCGAGHYLRSLRHRVSPDIRYTGVDPTAYYIELAGKAYGDTATFVTGSIFKIPFGDNTFDTVMCNNVVMHLPPEKIQQAFDELVRVARKRVIVRAMFGERNYIVREVLDTRDFNPAGGNASLTNGDDLTQVSFRYFNMYTEDYYRHLLSKHAGLRVNMQKDTDWKSFHNGGEAKTKTATYTMGEHQVSGNLILDWRYIIAEK